MSVHGFENFKDVFLVLDRPRISRRSGMLEHLQGLFRDERKVLSLDADLPQGCGLLQTANEVRHNIRRGALRFSHGSGHALLCRCAGLCVPSQDARQQHARSVSVRHPKGAPQHTTDDVAGSDGDTSNRPGDGKPGAQLAIETGAQVRRVVLDREQSFNQQL